MDQYITKVKTDVGDLQIDYNALANLPKSDVTLTQDEAFADAKATGDAIKQLSENKADKTSKVSAFENDAEYVTSSKLTEEINKLPAIKDGDEEVSDKALWSSKKISDELAALTSIAIDDEEISEKTLWSSKKTSEEIYKNGQEVLVRDRVYNYLDNSDLLNPINQREWASETELTSTTEIPKVYFLDRWCVDSGTVSPKLDANGLITNGHLVCQCLQRNRLVGKTVTAAIGLSNGKIIVGCGEVSGLNASDLGDRINGAQNAVNAMKNEDGTLKTDVSKEAYKNAEALLAKLKYLQEADVFSGITNDTSSVLLKMKDDPDKGLLHFYMSSDESATIQWAALYEGIYTADTLPKYQPKGYAAELMECKRYFRNIRGGAIVGFMNSKTAGYFGLLLEVPMRIVPTINVTTYGTIRGAGNSITPTGITVGSMEKCVIIFHVKYDETEGVANHVGVLGSGADFTLSADL